MMVDPADTCPYKIKMKRLRRLDGSMSRDVSWELVATRRSQPKVIGCGSAADRDAAIAQIDALIKEHYPKETELPTLSDVSEKQQLPPNQVSLVSIRLDKEILAYFRKKEGPH